MPSFRTLQMYILENSLFKIIGRFFFNSSRHKPSIARDYLGKQEQVFTNPPITTTSGIGNQASFHTTIQQLSAQARKPMIKFLGRRHPQPKFDPSAASSSSSMAHDSSLSKGTNVAKKSSAQSIDFHQLPARLRPKHLTEQEIHIINSGGCLD